MIIVVITMVPPKILKAIFLNMAISGSQKLYLNFSNFGLPPPGSAAATPAAGVKLFVALASGAWNSLAFGTSSTSKLFSSPEEFLKVLPD